MISLSCSVPSPHLRDDALPVRGRLQEDASQLLVVDGDGQVVDAQTRLRDEDVGSPQSLPLRGVNLHRYERGRTSSSEQTHTVARHSA